MSQQSSAQKPSLTGVKIKARKGAVKAQAKHEPSVFRDALYKHLETVTEGDFDGYYNKLVQAGSTLEFLKYVDAFYDIYFVGGLLQPGGSFVQDGAPVSPFTIAKAKEPAQVDDLKKYVEVLNKLIRRYKYLQKPLEENCLPNLIQYVNRWTVELREKFAVTIGLLMSQSIVTAAVLQNLSKDHLTKDGLSLSVATAIFRAYLIDQSMDQLGAALRRGGIRDLLVFLPANKRDPKALEDHLKKEGLPQVAEWFTKRQLVAARDSIVKILKELCGDETRSTDEIIEALKTCSEEQPIPLTDFIGCIWLGLTSVIDLNSNPAQVDQLVAREIDKYAPVLEAFCESGKTQVALINAVQVYCYDEQRVMKAFPQLIKILYNKDCISTQAIIYWHQKGAKPQGKQHFLKATEALVKFLEAQEDESEEDDE